MIIALMGKFYCKQDDNYSPIKVGTLLTTSSTPGHAMKSEDSVIRFHHWEGITYTRNRSWVNSYFNCFAVKGHNN